MFIADGAVDLLAWELTLRLGRAVDECLERREEFLLRVLSCRVVLSRLRLGVCVLDGSF